MTMLRIKSSLNPAIFRGTKYDRIVAGSIQEVNGKPWSHAYVAVKKGITFDQIEWVRPTPPKPVQPTVRQVQGSKGNWYTIRTLPDGRQECSCPGYQYRRFCKHTGAK